LTCSLDFVKLASASQEMTCFFQLSHKEAFMTVAKKVNYTPENVVTMVELYTSADSDETRQAAMETLSADLGKTVASIRSKLSHEGVYIAKAKAEKSGEKRILKSDLVDQIADNAGFENDEFFESLAGANKAVLEYILKLQNVNAE